MTESTKPRVSAEATRPVLVPLPVLCRTNHGIAISVIVEPKVAKPQAAISARKLPRSVMTTH
jgi:hypothetical protein